MLITYYGQEVRGADQGKPATAEPAACFDRCDHHLYYASSFILDPVFRAAWNYQRDTAGIHVYWPVLYDLPGSYLLRV